MKRFRAAVIAAATAVLGVAAYAGLGPVPGGASSHREAPLISADPQADTTDLYAFVSPDNADTVSIVANWIPFEEPAGGPNFYAWGERVRYDINIDNDADARPDLIYRWVFKNHLRNPDTFLYGTQVTSLDDPDLNFFQTYDLKRIDVGSETTTLVDDAVAVPSHVGEASMPSYATLRMEGITEFSGGDGMTVATQADDPFFLDLRVFDLLYGGNLSERGDDTLAGFNVNSLVLQVPKEDLAKGGDADANPIIGVWTATSRPGTRVLFDDGSQTTVGQHVQVSRLGMPLVNEVVIPLGTKDRFNASKPKDDGQFLSFVTEPELPELIEAVYGIPAPATPRNDLVQVFLTGVPGLNQPENVVPGEMLRLNMSIPPCPTACSRLGVLEGDLAGFPNGRRLQDDVIDIALQVVEGELVGSPNDLGDDVPENDVPFGGTFPYVALPHPGSAPMPH